MLTRLCESHYIQDIYYPYGGGGQRWLYIDDEGRVWALLPEEAEERNNADLSPSSVPWVEQKP